jgi:hypothetical protein
LNPSTPTENKSVALYWDFENLHASLSEARWGEGSYNKPDGRFKAQEPLIDVAAIMAMAATLGPIAINRAYCNWQFFGRYRDALLQGALELIQLFPPGGIGQERRRHPALPGCLRRPGTFCAHWHGGDCGWRQRLYAAGAKNQGCRGHGRRGR